MVLVDKGNRKEFMNTAFLKLIGSGLVGDERLELPTSSV
jgi:hypothetical protein